MGRGDPLCATCGDASEDVMHLLFGCAFSRACWIAGPLAIRSDALGQNLQEIIVLVNERMTEEERSIFANTMWALWRSRNERAFSGVTPSFGKFKKYFSDISVEALMAGSTKCLALPRQLSSSENEGLEDVNGYKCYIDGSWIQQWQGGIVFVLMHGSNLLAYYSAHMIACCAFQTEAGALLEAIKYVKGRGLSECTFYSDNKTLVELVTSLQPPTEADWRAYKECYESWKLIKQNSSLKCSHILRSQNDVADYLAKKGREHGWKYMGYTFPMF